MGTFPTTPLQTKHDRFRITSLSSNQNRHNYRRRKAQKRLSTGAHPQRNEQFEKIEELIETYQAAGNPVISMDTKKKN
ncbi:MAG: hypothetical protein KME50_36120 [Nostoc desertorum CM1-VF14]|nr:hypothetical protein [Nostoc desertorum CM1-VF14]